MQFIGMQKLTRSIGKIMKKKTRNYHYWDVINFGWKMLKKLSVDGFEWRKGKFRFYEQFIQGFDEDSDKGYVLEVGAKYPRELYKLHSHLSYLPKKMKIDNCKK